MNENIREMMREHIDARTYHMQLDKPYVFDWLLGEAILASSTELERMYMERMLNLLIVCGETDIEIAELNEDGIFLYHRVD